MKNLEATRYIKARVIFSGDVAEIWQYEHPMRADIIDRSGAVPERCSGEKREHNLFRARMEVKQLIWSNLTKYTKVLTLTFADTELDMDDMRYKIKQFLKQMKRSGYDLRYIWVPEHQTLRGEREGNEGSLHAHFVIFNDEKIPLDIVRKCWKWGSFDLHIANGCKTDNLEVINSLAAYLSKYITKQGIAEFGCRSFNPSLNLNRPVVRDIEIYKYYDNDGFPVWTDDGKQSFNDVFRDYDIKWKSGYNFTFKINGDDYTNSVLYWRLEK